MARSTQFSLSLIVAFALAVPALADAQATRRTGSTSSGSGSSGSSSGSSSGGATTRTAPPGSTTRTAVRRPSSSSSSSSSRGSATSRGSSSERSSFTDTRSLGRPVARRGGATVGSNGFSRISTRDRDGRPVRGIATVRPDTDVRTLYFPFVGPWGRWTPWYSAGFGYGGFGYFAYDPFFSPYYYDMYPYSLYGRATSPYAYRNYDDEPVGEAYGSVRLKANPDEARVYIDGALVGIVDDFNGLRNHLELAAGVHQIELRADGYDVYVGEITVDAGKTRTERLKLKKR